jgi:putative intracellular protease/amidase
VQLQLPLYISEEEKLNSMKRSLHLLSLLLCVEMSVNAQLRTNDPKNVAIFLYDGVELLDFAGPGEVFSASGFNTYTVSVDGGELTSQGFVKIRPEYSIENCPDADIIVIPGGNSGPSSNDPNVINWIRNANSRGATFMSVCTGAFIVAKAGLLENKRVTTHWGSTKSLALQYSTTTVLENTRWVDNGFVITTAGVSAGIDGALHFVSRVKGRDAAQRTARYMEYDKWYPDNGVVSVQHNTPDDFLPADGSPDRAPFPGEYLNYANKLVDKGDFDNAKRVLDQGVKLYPNFELYSVLRTIRQHNGEPVPVEQSVLLGLIRNGKVDEALSRFEKQKKMFPGWRIFDENSMNDTGYYLLLEKKDTAGAIKIFELNTREYPNSANTFDSLGEAQLLAGNKNEGLKSYRKAAALGGTNAKKVLKEMEGK